MDVEDYARWVLAPPRPVDTVLPHKSYFVCATPRCGSWFLCGLLASTGVAGRPHDWFWRDTRASLERAWGVRAAEYVELVLTAGTTPNGVFGAKVMHGALPSSRRFPSRGSSGSGAVIGWRRRCRLPGRYRPGTGTTATRSQRTTTRSTGSTSSTRSSRSSRSSSAGGRGGSSRKPSSRSSLRARTSSRTRSARRVLEFLSLHTNVEIRPLTVASRGAADDWAARYRTDITARRRV